MKALKVLSYAVSLYCLTIPAAAHDKWANGVEVPSWVKRSCCGPEDVHRLTAYSDEAGRGFRSEAGRCSDVKPATIPI